MCLALSAAVALAPHSLLRLPKVQVLVYSLFMVPVVYGAAKLVAAPGVVPLDKAAGIACLVLVPMPVLAFWVYVLAVWQAALTASVRGELHRSKSALLRTYQQSLSGSGDRAAGDALGRVSAQRSLQQQQRGPATLALLGDDTPTLIIRDKRSGEEVFEHTYDADEDEGGAAPLAQGARAATNPQSGGRPWRPGAGGSPAPGSQQGAAELVA
jgi:hypothetical protein